MPPTKPEPSEHEADPRGIMQCLRMLTEEAATLGLGRTCEALREALDVCAAESGLAPVLETTVGDGADTPAGPGVLH